MDKKEQLEERINDFVHIALVMADMANSLDQFNIEISNDNGCLNMDYTLKNKKKIY